MQEFALNDCNPIRNAEEVTASRFIMDTLGVLLIVALIIGGVTGEYAIAFWCALMGWIPAVLLFGGIIDKVKMMQATHRR